MGQERRGGPTRTEWAYDTLKAQIMGNELDAGASYLEEDLATRLGISRTPLREAALRLASEGFVRVRPRRGIQILPVAAEDMAEIYDILTLIEPHAAGILAERRLSAEDLAPLSDALAEMETAEASDDRAAWAEADRAFHAALLNLAGNKRLHQIASTLWDQVHRARVVTLEARTDLSASNADHRALLDRIASGDATGAQDLFRHHRVVARDRLLRILSTHDAEAL